MTLVSVCIPARGHGRFLGEALDSALSQDVDGLEVLVHDDASDEDLGAIVRAAGDARVRYQRHPRPLGVAENRNSCLAAARGRYVAWLDADDAYLPGALARQLAVLEADRGVAIVHGAPEIVDADGHPQRTWRRPHAHDAIEPGLRAFSELILSNELTTSTVVARRSALDAAGPFVASGPSSSDWDMWLRLVLRGDLAYSAAPVARYRQHADTISRASSAGGERLRSDARVAARVLRTEAARIPRRDLQEWRARAALAAKALLHAGDLQTRGEPRDGTAAVLLAAKLAPGTVGSRVAPALAAIACGDEFGWHTQSKRLLARLALDLRGSRFGAVIARAAAGDEDWDATLARIARAVRATTSPDDVVGTVTKWDPTLLRLSGRRGRQFPDRRLLPEGYPADGETAVAHLEQLRAEGLSYLVLPSASFWWLEHYEQFAHRLQRSARLAHADADCRIYELGAA